jgi:hypothetical protein
MNDAPTPQELNRARSLLEQQDYPTEGIDILMRHGEFPDAFYILWRDDHEPPPPLEPGKPTLWEQVTQQLRASACEQDSFRQKVEACQKHPDDAALLTDLIAAVSDHTESIKPAIATVIALYILHIGLETFCSPPTA